MKHKLINSQLSNWMTYQMYLRQFLTLAENVFIYDNMPDYIDTAYLNKTLVRQGTIAFFYDDVLEKVLALPYTNIGSLDVYNRIYSNVIKNLSIDSDNGEQTLNNNCFFGTFCYGNTFEVDSSKNTFGDHCDMNTFGGGYSHNTVGNECMINTFGGTCYNNTFGNYCYNNTFGNDCSDITFGNNCYNNTFGNGCSYIKLASTSSTTTKYEYYRQNHIGDGCQYIVFTGAGTASLNAQIQNYNFAQGLQGTSKAYLTVNGERSRSYETKVAQNSNGDLKIYCEADLIK